MPQNASNARKLGHPACCKACDNFSCLRRAAWSKSSSWDKKSLAEDGMAGMTWFVSIGSSLWLWGLAPTFWVREGPSHGKSEPARWFHGLLRLGCSCSMMFQERFNLWNLNEPYTSWNLPKVAGAGCQGGCLPDVPWCSNQFFRLCTLIGSHLFPIIKTHCRIISQTNGYEIPTVMMIVRFTSVWGTLQMAMTQQCLSFSDLVPQGLAWSQ